LSATIEIGAMSFCNLNEFNIYKKTASVTDDHLLSVSHLIRAGLTITEKQQLQKIEAM